MDRFTSQGQQAIQDLAGRYNLSTDAVITMLYAVMNGGGTMAQFSHPELGGSGQWMRGGMTMVGDMFNNGLKMTVDNLCSELSNLLQNQQNLFKPQPVFTQNNSFSGQSQFQGNGSYAQNQGQWWPNELGSPSSTGAQNNSKYAVFPQQQRLAILLDGNLTIYNTLDHQIGGVSQQQGGLESMTFSSQYGTVRVVDLPVISVNGNPPPIQQTPTFQQEPFQQQPRQNNTQSGVNVGSNTAQEADIFATLERLADLQQKGIIGADEFAQKKAELLARL